MSDDSDNAERDPDPAILRAAQAKDWDRVRSLAESGCAVDATGSDWQKTALYYAAEEGQAGLVDLLLEKGADGTVRPFGHSNFTVLHRAAQKGHEDVVRLLLDRTGCGTLAQTDNGGQTPLSMAAEGGHCGALSALVERGAPLDCMQTEWSSGRTPLHLAAAHGHCEAARLLVAAGCDKDAVDYGAARTPLMLAAEGGHLDVVKMLLGEGCDADRGTLHRTGPIPDQDRTYTDYNSGEEVGITTVHCDDGTTALHLAAQRGWMSVVLLLIAERPNLLHRRTRTGYTVLHYAAVGGAYDVVKMLLEKHRDALDAQAAAEDGRTALHDAAWSAPYEVVKARSQTTKKDCLRLLVDQGWSLGAATREGMTALHMICDSNDFCEDKIEIVKMLLELGSDPNARTVDGRSALCFSSWSLEIQQLLLNRGCTVTPRDLRAAADMGCQDLFKLLHAQLDASLWDPSAVDEEGCTLLHVAARGCCEELLQALLDLGCDPMARTKDGKTALHLNDRFALPGTVGLLVDRGCDINAKDCDGWPAMFYVMRDNDGSPGFLNMLEFCLRKGWDASARANDGTTALHILMTMSLFESDVEVAQLLLDSGCEATAVRSDGRTALHLIPHYGKDLLELLQAAGCDPTATANDGKSLLHELASEKSMVATLLAKGCDATARDADGMTPLHYAAQHSYADKSVRLLIQAGGEVAARAKDGCTPLHLAAKARGSSEDKVVRVLLEHGAEVDAVDDAGRTPLHFAAGESCQLSLETLLDAGADVNARMPDGTTALHLAARRGSVGAVQLLLDRGADCDAADSRGATPLHVAADSSVAQGISQVVGKPGVVRLLLQRGCAVDARTADGCTALHLAAQGGRLHVARLIVEAGPDRGVLAAIEDGLHGRPEDHAVDVDRKLVPDTAARQVVRALLEAGCDVNAVALDGKTALERAAARMSSVDVRRLLG